MTVFEIGQKISLEKSVGNKRANMYGRYSIQARLCSQYKRQHIQAFSSARLQKYNFWHEYSNGL